MNAGVILFLIFAVCVLIGVPISMSLGIGSLAAVALGNLGVSPAVIAQRVFGGLQSTSIMAIAFFILAGNLMAGGGISRRIVNFANCLIGNIRGGMSVALVIACAFFAALSGSAPATVVAIGSMLYADMVKQGYPEDRTAGLLVIAGGLGPVIPPSIIMVLYCTLTGASVTNMFSQGMVIGILIMIVLILEALYYAHKEKWPKAETKHTAGEIGKIFLEAVPALMTPVIILGGIYSGLLTATESAAVACVWAFIAGVFIYKEIKIADLIPILMKSAKSAAMILFIIAASTAFSWVFTFSGASAALVQLVVSMNLNKTLFCLVVAIILLIFGTFMEGINENYIVYDSFYEMGWRKEMDVFDWVEHYSDWRYGKNAKLRLAWRQLMDTVYSPSQGGGHSVMAYEPRLNQRSRPTYIDVSLESLRLYQAAAKEMETLSNAFRYDYVDLAREVMVDLFAETNMMLRVALDRCIIMEKEFLVAKDTDSPGSDLGRVGDCGEGHPKKCDPQELIKLCEQTPDCVGFNMNGYLKSNTDTKTPCRFVI